MPSPTLHGGWFRHLLRGDEAALLEHYRRLSASDRQRRFLHAVGDGYLAMHAACLRETGYDVIGWLRDGALRGVAEVAAGGGFAEAAFSVEAPWRDRGVGRALMRRALRRARLSGCGRLVVHTAGDNHPMLRIAADFGARISLSHGEAVGELTPAPASPAELSFDIVEDRIGLFAAGSELALNLLAPRWRPAGPAP